MTTTIKTLFPKETPLIDNTKKTVTLQSTAFDTFLAKAIAEKKRTGPATRLETAMLSLNARGTSIERAYVCQKRHTDTHSSRVPSYTCQVAEKAQAAGMISQTNTQFKPLQTVSRIEAYSIMMKSICVHPVTNANNWQKEVIKKAMQLGFTVRNLNTFEPDKPLLIPEMYAVVKRLNDYAKEHNTCEVF